MFLQEYRHLEWGDVSGFWYYCGMGDNTPEWTIFSMILSFLVAIPAMAFQNDISAKTYTAIWTRTTRKEYFLSKMKAVFCVEYLVTFIPFFLNFLLCCLSFRHIYTASPSPYGETDTNLNRIIDDVSEKSWTWGVSVPFGGFFKACPVLYVFLFLLFMCAFVGFMGVFLMAISYWFRRFKILLFLPVIAMVKVGSVLSNWAYEVVHRNNFQGKTFMNYNIWDYVSPMSYSGKIYPVFFAFLFLLGIFIYFSYRMICKKEYTDV